jgi:hypothetical protein
MLGRATDALTCLLDSLVKWSKALCRDGGGELVWLDSGEVLPRAQVLTYAGVCWRMLTSADVC